MSRHYIIGTKTSRLLSSVNLVFGDLGFMWIKGMNVHNNIIIVTLRYCVSRKRRNNEFWSKSIIRVYHLAVVLNYDLLKHDLSQMKIYKEKKIHTYIENINPCCEIFEFVQLLTSFGILIINYAWSQTIIFFNHTFFSLIHYMSLTL